MLSLLLPQEQCHSCVSEQGLFLPDPISFSCVGRISWHLLEASGWCRVTGRVTGQERDTAPQCLRLGFHSELCACSQRESCGVSQAICVHFLPKTWSFPQRTFCLEYVSMSQWFFSPLASIKKTVMKHLYILKYPELQYPQNHQLVPIPNGKHLYHDNNRSCFQASPAASLKGH